MQHTHINKHKYKGFLPKTNKGSWSKGIQAWKLKSGNNPAKLTGNLTVERPPNEIFFAFCFQFLHVAVWELVPNPQVQHINAVHIQRGAPYSRTWHFGRHFKRKQEGKNPCESPGRDGGSCPESTADTWAVVQVPGRRWQLLRQDTGTIWGAHDATDLLLLKPHPKPSPEQHWLPRQAQGLGTQPQGPLSAVLMHHITSSPSPQHHSSVSDWTVSSASQEQRNLFVWSRKTPFSRYWTWMEPRGLHLFQAQLAGGSGCCRAPSPLTAFTELKLFALDHYHSCFPSGLKTK